MCHSRGVMDEIIEEEDYELRNFAIYLLHTEDIEVNSDNSYIVIDSDISNLANVNATFKNIHGFTPQSGSVGFSLKDSNLICGFGIDETSNLPDIYLTPGSYICGMDIVGQKDNQLAYVSLEGDVIEFESGSENRLDFGGTLTGKIGVDKTKYIPGEELNIDCSITDSYGNKLLYMDYIYNDMYKLFNGQNILTYKTGQNKVQIRSFDSLISALEESAQPEEPIEIEYKSPAEITLVDSKGNEIMKSELYYLQSDSDDVYDENFLIINSTVYVKEGKSPANYSLSSSQLQRIDFEVKDEEGKVLDRPTGYFLSMPFGSSTYSSLLGMNLEVFGIKVSMGDVYISKGNYSFSTEVLSQDSSSTERIIFKPNVAIGLITKNTQMVQFTSENLTEVSLDSKSNSKYIQAVLSDTKTGFTSSLNLIKNKPVKVSKGLYEMDILCESMQYGNNYIYVMNSQKDFTSDNTIINCGTDFSMSIKPNKSIYKAGETLKTTNVISDRYGNRVVDIYGDSYYMFLSEICKSSKGRVVLKKVNGEIKPYDIITREYVEIPYYDIRAPFIYIKDSFDDVILSAKSPDFYTKSEIKLDPKWIDSGYYKIEWTLDIDADGNMSAESSFKVK